MTVTQQLDKIFEENKTKKALKAAILSLFAEDRRNWVYYTLGLDKAYGPKWVEKIAQQAAKDHSGFGDEPEDANL